MYNKKLKLLVIMFLVGLAGVIYTGYNTSGYTSDKETRDKENTDIIFYGTAVSDSPIAGETDKPLTEATHKPLTDEASTEVYEVYICGCVKKPGVYTLKAGSRLYEYLELAGGYTSEADTEYENLARTLKDGEKVYFPSKKQVNSGELEYGIMSDDGESIKESGINGGDVSDSNHQSNKVNINTAGIDELTTLTGIGESRAKTIIAYRQANGNFKAIEDIMLVNGIKESVYNKIKEHITV